MVSEHARRSCAPPISPARSPSSQAGPITRLDRIEANNVICRSPKSRSLEVFSLPATAHHKLFAVSLTLTICGSPSVNVAAMRAMAVPKTFSRAQSSGAKLEIAHIPYSNARKSTPCGSRLRATTPRARMRSSLHSSRKPTPSDRIQDCPLARARDRCADAQRSAQPRTATLVPPRGVAGPSAFTLRRNGRVIVALETERPSREYEHACACDERRE